MAWTGAKGEEALLRRIRRLIPTDGNAAIALGIGDDCAIVRPSSPGVEWLITTDLVIEDVHFRHDVHPSASVGHRTLARGLSDVAAMGGRPRFCLLSLALSKKCDSRWVDGFLRGFGKLARREDVTLAGGDLARAAMTFCDVVVLGDAPRGSALRRDGAKPGDQIYVSGLLGGSALGLRTGKGPAWKRHLRPEPRVALGSFLRGKLRATAAMDLSDGLSLDLHRLALASGVTASVERALPRFRGASEEDALHGGEDYELLFTLPPSVRPPATYRGVLLTRIGEIREGPAGRVLYFGRPLAQHGYDHFRAG